MKTMEHHSNPFVTMAFMVMSFIGFLFSSLISVHITLDIVMKITSFMVGVVCSMVVIISHWPAFKVNLITFRSDVKSVLQRIFKIK